MAASPRGPLALWLAHWPKLALLLALGLHFHLVTANWSARFLPGHEFRQAQTAISATFIAREDNYSLAYPTPLFGPPWSIPMEFPLYQWGTAWLSTHTDWSVVESGRALNLACFYLSLVGLVLLLRELRPRETIGRWLAPTLLLCSPVYLFFTRAVLIESMALMFSVWFLWAFARMCHRSSLSWAVVASVLGGLAALVKVTTFMAWCGAAALGGILWSWQQWRAAGWAAWRRTLWLGTVTAVLPGGLTVWWLRTADAIKATSPGGSWLQSENLRSFNLGTWADRTNPTTWAEAATNAARAVSPAWIILAVAVAATALAWRRRDRWPWIALAWFIAVPVGFPILYSYHDYYFYANGIALLTAAAWCLAGLQNLRHRLRYAAPLLLIAVCAAQLHGYIRDYREIQLVDSPGGTLVTALIREKLPTDSVLIVLGDDWAASIPFYADRRAFMLHNQIMGDPATAVKLLGCLEDEEIAGLLVAREMRDKPTLIEPITTALDLDPQISITDGHHDLYLSNHLRGVVRYATEQDPNYRTLVVNRAADEPVLPPSIVADNSLQAVPPELAESLFSFASPRPHHYSAKYDLEVANINGQLVLTAHPDADIWIQPPPTAHTVKMTFGMRPESYERAETLSDGVEFIVYGVDAAGTQTPLFTRTLTPVSAPADRGAQTVSFPLPSPLPAHLIFATRRNEGYSFDWAYWQRIEVK
ncbi:ArnT family glycosyltransferase [Actomonas aquatica]|uniref:Glycosyltransferase family 39 protein n=1 Tax=Actomonas aquatica TaxID=2866162 RepID=A0ABZ1C7S8_9BACT|nr:glycosyltransferase family 39 protein [Opitutus sp. WL0086]WRQ87498.1 glycosyltransferase family 39 protein [Opitutus sp. WL0086]